MTDTAKILGVTCLRNEGPYIVDWLSHHLAAGFDHMLILTHDCDDGSDVLLDALAKDPRITHLSFNFTAKKTVQWQALNIAKKHPLVEAADWVLFFDCDEYLCLPEPHLTLPELLETLPKDAEAIAFPWRLFGANGEQHFDTAPVTRRFTAAAPTEIHYPLANLFKTLFRPSSFRQMGVHRPRHKKDTAPKWFIANGQPMPPPLARDDKAISLYTQIDFTQVLPCLNHYSVRSAEEFLLKTKRGLPNHMDRQIDLSYWAERNFNTVTDTTIHRMAAQTATLCAEFLAQDQVATLHAGCITEHKRRIADLMTDIENVRLIWRLGLLASSTPPTKDRARQYIQQQIRINRTNG